jgi:ornithine cyclodeaminase
MLYLNTESIKEIGVDWAQAINVIRSAIFALHANDYAQPIKPYLRYGDIKNRIIAMPAYVGGGNPVAGIKWIASFPDNIHKNKQRAHSVTVLNEHDSGRPFCIINTAAVSAIRTAAVSGLMITEYLKVKKGNERLTVGIIGFGPIGRMHLDMVAGVLEDRLEKVLLYDLKTVDASSIPEGLQNKVVLCESWEDCYREANIFITCTVSDKPYINIKPLSGSLQLNVSLRDYKPEMRQYMDTIIVDEWEEVCRQNTDIENMHKTTGLQKEDTLSMAEVVCQNALQQLSSDDAVIMVNPMGMAMFDMAIGEYYYRKALNQGIGLELPD